ncbi:MAG: YdcF family protein [Acidothermaceae bacterium]
MTSGLLQKETSATASVARRLVRLVRRHRIVAALVAVVIAAVAVIDVRLFVVPTSAAAGPTDAFVVLGGGTYDLRLNAALKLVREYPGAALLVSVAGHKHCPHFAVGASQIICFNPDPMTTQGEAREATLLAHQHGWTSMTVVTTADQIWRAGVRFSRCWSGDLRLVQAPTSAWIRLRSIPYEMGATVKAEVFQRSC